jgi:hypothetical protein
MQALQTYPRTLPAGGGVTWWRSGGRRERAWCLGPERLRPRSLSSYMYICIYIYIYIYSYSYMLLLLVVVLVVLSLLLLLLCLCCFCIFCYKITRYNKQERSYIEVSTFGPTLFVFEFSCFLLKV